eukprot:jgi/Tetstr1/465563/TSEL_000124.t1
MVVAALGSVLRAPPLPAEAARRAACVADCTPRRRVATPATARSARRPGALATPRAGWRRGPAGRRSGRGIRAPRAGDELAEGVSEGAVRALGGEEQWEGLLALERRLAVAVELENYELAAKLRDDQARMCSEVPLSHRYILGLVKKLRAEATAREELLEAAVELGECGHSYDAVPELVAALHRAVAADDVALQEAVSDAMWAIFLRSANPRVNALMKVGTDLMAAGSLPEATKVFTEIIELEPSFAEGYNKRATVLYIMQKLEESVADCEAVLQREPHHFGALSGMGLCLYKMGDLPAALDAFDRTVRVHPGLTEIRKLAEQIRAKLAG